MTTFPSLSIARAAAAACFALLAPLAAGCGSGEADVSSDSADNAITRDENVARFVKRGVPSKSKDARTQIGEWDIVVVENPKQKTRYLVAQGYARGSARTLTAELVLAPDAAGKVRPVLRAPDGTLAYPHLTEIERKAVAADLSKDLQVFRDAVASDSVCEVRKWTLATLEGALAVVFGGGTVIFCSTVVPLSHGTVIGVPVAVGICAGLGAATIYLSDLTVEKVASDCSPERTTDGPQPR
jgi:hypothetical protein